MSNSIFFTNQITNTPFDKFKGIIEGLSEKHTPHSDGWVIMGSSNLSESGLGLTQPPKYELNVAMKDYDDVALCKSEFDKLWKEGQPLTFEDIERYTKQTHIGRVNRIGLVAGTIVNYLFYPSAEGDAQIKLYKKALAKLQGFHSAYGEDSQIYSKEEIVEQFELFNTNIGDDVDKSLDLLRVVREFKAKNPDWFEQIRELPIKSRTARTVAESGKKIKPNSSLVYIASPYKKEFYKVESGEICDIGFMEVIEQFEAKPEEKAAMLPTCHYQTVSKAHGLFDEQVTKMMDDSTTSTPSEKDNTTDAVKSLLRKIWREFPNTKTHEQCDILTKYVELGTYTKLTRDLARLERKYKKRELTTIDIETAIKGFMARYHKKRQTKVTVEEEITPQIILSETFI